MKIMRMASGRGKSHFDVGSYLKPFLEQKQILKYPLNINSSNEYYYDVNSQELDRTSFLPDCYYAKVKGMLDLECDLFEPVLTDNGICYAFNAEQTLELMNETPYKQIWKSAYGSEFKKFPKIEYAKGAGEYFALQMMISNRRYLRHHQLKIVISKQDRERDSS